MKLGKLRIRKKSFALEVLKKIAIGGAFLIAASNKRFWFNFYLNYSKEFGKYKNKKEKQKLYNALNYLRQKKFVDIMEKPNGISVKIASKGYEVLEFYESIEKMQIRQPKCWDRKFRIVIFDIPVKKQTARMAFIQKLKDLGFYMLQKSIWVHPYDCVNEIATLRKLFEIEAYVKIMKTEGIEEEYKLLKHFRLLT